MFAFPVGHLDGPDWVVLEDIYVLVMAFNLTNWHDISVSFQKIKETF